MLFNIVLTNYANHFQRESFPFQLKPMEQHFFVLFTSQFTYLLAINMTLNKKKSMVIFTAVFVSLSKKVCFLQKVFVTPKTTVSTLGGLVF